jgi:hypothetical protein
LNREGGTGRFDPVMEYPNEGKWKNESYAHPEEKAITVGASPGLGLLGWQFFNAVRSGFVSQGGGFLLDYLWTTPQAIRSPELPDGSVFMSSAFAWIMSAVPPLEKSE